MLARLSRQRLDVSALSRFLRYGLAVVLALSAVGVDAALHILRGNAVFFFPLAAIIVASLVGGLGPGLLATVLAVCGESLFILMPFSHGVPEPRRLVAEALFAALAVATAWLGAGFRDARAGAERALAELDALLESSPVGHSFYDRRLRHVSVNPSLAALIGRPVDDFRGTLVRDMIPHLADRVEPVLRKVLREGVAEGPLRVSGELPAGSGQQRHLLANFFPVILPGGELIGAGASVVDITEQTRSEEQRLQVLAERDALLRHMQHGVITMRAPDGEILFYNARAEAIFGRPPKRPDLAEQKERCHFVREDGSALPAAEYPPMRALATGAQVDAQRIRFASGGSTMRTIEMSAAPIRDESGQITATVAVFSDVTDRVEGEERAQLLGEITTLLTTSFDYREAVRVLAERVVPRLADWCLIDLFDEDGRIERVAIAHSDPVRVQRAWEIYRRFRGDIYDSKLGAAFLSQAEPLLLSEVDEATLKMFANDEEHLEALHAFEARSALGLPLTTRGRTIGSLLLLDAGSGRHFGARDLEFLRELARRVALAVDNAQLFQRAQEAVHARDDFMAVASHDLRTPVTTLRLLLQGLLRHAERTDGDGTLLSAVRGQLVTAERQTSRIMTMLEELLDVSRVQAGRLTLDRKGIDLVALVREAAGRLETVFATARCPMTIEAPSPVRGEWDAGRIDQVVTNLLTNAAKYGCGKPIEVSVLADDGSAVLTVRDHGVGIAPGDQTKLFHRFERVGDQKAFQGTGMGLWISRRIVEAHGGKISVESMPGDGATFVVRLPR